MIYKIDLIDLINLINCNLMICVVGNPVVRSFIRRDKAMPCLYGSQNHLNHKNHKNHSSDNQC